MVTSSTTQKSWLDPWFIYLIMTSVIMGRVLTTMTTSIDFVSVALAAYFVSRYFFFTSFASWVFKKERVELFSLCTDAFVLVTLGMIMENPYLYHLALIPSAYGYFFARGKNDLTAKAGLPLWFVWSSMATYQIIFKKSIFASKAEFSFFFLFCATFSTFAIMKYRMRIRNITRAQTNEGEESLFEAREKHFFHDVINHTHGLCLFLERRTKAGLNPDDTQFIAKEVVSLQELIVKHYGLKHKEVENLVEEKFYLKDAFESFSYWIETYLPESQAQSFLEIGPNFKKHLHEQWLMVNRPAFLRVMVNLIKNIHDYKSTEAHFSLDVNDQDQMVFTFRNNLHAVASNSPLDLDHVLGEMILTSKKSDKNGIGLNSIEQILGEIGGHFSYRVENHYFVVQGHFPLVYNEIIPTKKVA